jgi:hypothetical protein
VTNKNKRAKGRNAAAPPRSATRSVPASGAPPRRGLLDSIFAPRVAGSSSMPGLRTSVGRGFAVSAGTPAIAVGVAVAVILEWLVVLALGFEGPFARFTNALALPPVGSSFDATLSVGLFGQRIGFLAILGFVVVRAVVQALFVAAVVEVLRSSSLGRWTLVRALRTLPATLAVGMAAVGILTIAGQIGAMIGTIGLFLQLGALVFGVYLLAFAPVIAASETRRLADSLGRSIRAARVPGAGNLTLAAIYVFLSFVVLAVVPWPGSQLGVNPTVAAWVVVLVANLLHIAMQSAVAFRYLSVAGEVPEAAPKRRSAPRASGRR